MRFLELGQELIFLLCLLYLANVECNRVCYNAKVCIHNGREKCGVNAKGSPRRFLDSCDIMEYNCLKGTDYMKTSMEKCSSLPPIDEDDTADKEADKRDDDKDKTSIDTTKKEEIGRPMNDLKNKEPLKDFKENSDEKDIGRQNQGKREASYTHNKKKDRAMSMAKDRKREINIGDNKPQQS